MALECAHNVGKEQFCVVLVEKLEIPGSEGFFAAVRFDLSNYFERF